VPGSAARDDSSHRPRGASWAIGRWVAHLHACAACRRLPGCHDDPVGVLGGSRTAHGLQTDHQNGTAFTDRDINGKPIAIFFGFTSCPDNHTAAVYLLDGEDEYVGALTLADSASARQENCDGCCCLSSPQLWITERDRFLLILQLARVACDIGRNDILQHQTRTRSSPFGCVRDVAERSSQTRLEIIWRRRRCDEGNGWRASSGREHARELAKLRAMPAKKCIGDAVDARCIGFAPSNSLNVAGLTVGLDNGSEEGCTPIRDVGDRPSR
jgi:hypothetical protein